MGSMGRPGFKSPLHQVLLSNPQLQPPTPHHLSAQGYYIRCEAMARARDAALRPPAHCPTFSFLIALLMT